MTEGLTATPRAGDHQAVEDAVWRISGRGARLLVDLDAIEQNVATIKANISPRARIMAVVKAGGYGHGGPLTAEAAVKGGAAWLAVATICEGIELRQAGINVPILVLGPTMPAESIDARMHQLHITVGSIDHWTALSQQVRNQPLECRLGVHLEINTGMNRFGVNPDNAVTVAKSIVQSRDFSLDGVFTHFASADEQDTTSTRRQADLYMRCLDELRREGVDPGLVHASNSAAMLRFREYDFDMVRPGISVYGVRPAAGVDLFAGMRPALRVSAVVQRLEPFGPPGSTAGYGETYAGSPGERLGLLALGYADGYPRSLSNRGWVGFRGTRLPVAGRVSMDQTSISVPETVTLSVGDRVSVIGNGLEGEPTLEEIAAIAGTIPYETMTGLGQRLPAYYLRADHVVVHDHSGSSAATSNSKPLTAES